MKISETLFLEEKVATTRYLVIIQFNTSINTRIYKIKILYRWYPRERQSQKRVENFSLT